MMMINDDDDDDDDLPGHLDADGLDPGDDLARGDARPHLEPLVRPVRYHKPAQPWHLCCRAVRAGNEVSRCPEKAPTSAFTFNLCTIYEVLEVLPSVELA